MARPRAKLAGTIALLLVHAAPFPACDPGNLTPQQRLLVTGTSDVGNLSLTAPADVRVDGDTIVAFEVRSRSVGNSSFEGRISLDLSGLPPEISLVEDLHPKAFAMDGDGAVPGFFVLRAVGTRVDPAVVLLTMTSTGTGGSVVVHPPVAIRVTARGALGVTCQRTPDEGRVPLEVTFTAQPSNCDVSCEFVWDFGDGHTEAARNTTHTYTAPGSYLAQVRLTDIRFLPVTCSRLIRVLDRGSSPSTPSVPGTGPTPTPTATPSVNRSEAR
jgi:hypothetical protein